MKKIIICSIVVTIVSCNRYSKPDEVISSGMEKSKGSSMEESSKPEKSGYWDYIEKYQWNLIQIKGAVVEKSDVNIRFDLEKKGISGFNGCNYFFGSFTASGDKLSINAAGSTKMACPEKESRMERDFSEILQQKNFTFDVADQTLNLYKDGKIILMFGRAEKNN